MKNTLPHLINLPPFVYRGLSVENYGLIRKVFFVIYGKIISLIINFTEKKIFCFLINLFFRDTKVVYSSGMYASQYNDKIIYFPNKRVLRFVNNPNLTIDRIYNTYCLDFISFDSNDKVIDCGANVGELYVALESKKINVEYIAFEPDANTFDCLSLNNQSGNLHNVALSNINKEEDFYLDNEGGNSSLIDFGAQKSIKVQSKKLDSFNFKNIKLLKIDAEGYEPEVLEGAVNTLKEIEYVSVDFGSERGVKQENTVAEVNKIMYENNFHLYKFSEFRIIGLYKRN